MRALCGPCGPHLRSLSVPAICVAMRTLTARQEGFAVAVAKGATKADAYRQNYKTDGWGAQAVADAANKLSNKSEISHRIEKLTEVSTRKAEAAFSIDVSKLLQTFFEIAFTDPNELTSMQRGACRYCWGLGGAYQWKEREYAEAMAKWEKDHHRWQARSGPLVDEPAMPDGAGGFGYRFFTEINPHCTECEGRGEVRMHIQDTTLLSPGAKHLYRGVQQTKDGYKLLFGDKDKALDSLGRMLGAFDDRLRVDLKGAVASIALTTTDPSEAARAYEQMLVGS